MDERIQCVLQQEETLLPAGIETAAAVARLSVPHFRFLFRQSIGVPYAAWLKQRRLETAMQLLQHTSLTIPQICHRIGVQDASHFIRSFKRRYGRTPAACRLHH